MSHSDELIAARRAELDEERQQTVLRSRRLGIAAGTIGVTLVMVLAVVDGLDALDTVGVDDRTAASEAGPIELEVRYPSVTRPALASPLEIIVHREGGFDQPIQLAVDAEYLMAWDVNGIVPTPSSEISGGDVVIWEFDPPSGDVLHVRYDGRIEPARQDSVDGRVAVVEGDSELVAVDFKTQIRP